MSRWRRRSRATTDDSAPSDPPPSDVRIVGPAERSSERSKHKDGVLAELSQAFRGEPDADDLTGETDTGARPDRTTISIGGDDGTDDIQYLDEALGGTDDASDTVFIDDDGTGDALPTKDATGRGIEPRLRQRRIGVRRAEGRRRLKILSLLVLVMALVVAVLATLGSSLFSVNDVDVAGRQFADADLVQAVVDDLQDKAVLLVDTDAAEDRLEAIPFVDSARVRTEFPSTVRVELRERVPVATTQGSDGRFRILDGEGRVLDVIGGQPVAFVLIDGPEPLDVEAGAFAPTGFAAAGAMVTKLTPEIRSRLVSISTTRDGSDLRMLLRNEPFDPVEVRLGAAISDTDQFERLVRLQLLLDDVAGRDTDVIDVSTAEATER